MTPLSRADKRWLRSAPVPAPEEFIEIASQSQAVRAVVRALRLQEEETSRGRRESRKPPQRETTP